MTDPTDLIAQADAALDGVTEGPWRIVDCDSMGNRCTHYYQEVWNSDFDVLVTTEVTRAHFDGGRNNIRFIAASRQLVPALRDALAAERARVVAMEAAIQDAIDCGMVPKTSAKEGGAARYSEQVRVADMMRAALTGEPQR